MFCILLTLERRNILDFGKTCTFFHRRPSITPIETVLSKLGGVKTVSGGYSARCPAHDDKTASLSIKEGEDSRVLLYCHAGCETQAVISTLGLEMQDLFPPSKKSKAKTKGKVIATYDYRDKNGVVKYQVLRLDPKGDFPQRRPDPDKPGKWIYNLKGVQPLLYKLPELIAAVAKGRKIIICEGEKDVLTLTAQGITATCNSGGASKGKCKFPKEMVHYFKDANVYIIPDMDEPGRKHAASVAALLHGIAKETHICPLPDHKDISVFFEAGKTKKDLIELLKVAPIWEPSHNPPAPTSTSSALIPPDAARAPFRFLGYNRGRHYYMSNATGQITPLTLIQFT